METTAWDAILIDDDALVHLTWNFAAKKNGKRLKTFFDPQDFIQNLREYDRETSIYVDANLGNGIRGEAVAKIIYESGFKSIYLATGHPADHFIALDWLKGVVGKEPPWGG